MGKACLWKSLRGAGTGRARPGGAWQDPAYPPRENGVRVIRLYIFATSSRNVVVFRAEAGGWDEKINVIERDVRGVRFFLWPAI